MASAASDLLHFGLGSPSPRRLLPQDDFLPGLAVAVDAAAMMRRLKPILLRQAPLLRLERFAVERVKYHPGRRCVIGYRLSMRDTAGGGVFDHWLTARVFEAGAANSRYEKALRAALAPTLVGPPVILLEDLEMILWSFPNDRHLPALPALTDAARLRAEIAPTLVETALGEGWTIEAHSSAIASYVHERRCSVRLDLRLSRAAGLVRRDWTVYGKTIGEEADGAGDEASERLWESVARRRGALAMARPLGAPVDPRIDWREAISGAPLSSDGGGALDIGAFRRAGAAIAALHAIPLENGLCGCPNDGAERLVERANAMMRGWPSLRAEVAPLAARLSNAITETSEHAPRVTGHGDLHARNILVDGERVALIDLDEALPAPPLRDLGHFAAYLLWAEGASGRSEPEIKEAISAFVSGYRQEAPWPAPATEIALHAASALLSEKIFRHLTLMQPEDGRLWSFLEIARRLSRGETAILGLEDAAS